MTRNEAREIMMQILYEIDAKNFFIDKNTEKARILAAELSEERLAGAHKTRGAAIICSVIDNIDEIDDSINRCSTKWKTSRMPKVDLAIMRLAAGEISFCDDIPEAVSINEAVNMAKKFSTDNSARFIHGVLGTLTKADVRS